MPCESAAKPGAAPAESGWRIDPDRLRERLQGPARQWQLTLVEQTGSTNADLLAHCRESAWRDDPAAVVARLAYRQTAGRGRQGRPWRSQAGMTFSVALPLPLPPARLAGLSLAVGLSVADALAECDEQLGRRVGLKWPNDLQIDQRKLAGILIETAPARQPPVAVAPPGGGATGAGNRTPGVWAVIGVGLNLVRDAEMEAALGRGLAGVAEAWAGFDPRHSPTVLFAAVLNHLAAMRDDFVQRGFAPMAARWSARDAYRDQPVRLLHDGQPLAHGMARGVDGDGHLLLETDTGMQAIASGELSLRPLGPGGQESAA